MCRTLHLVFLLVILFFSQTESQQHCQKDSLCNGADGTVLQNGLTASGDIQRQTVAGNRQVLDGPDSKISLELTSAVSGIVKNRQDGRATVNDGSVGSDGNDGNDGGDGNEKPKSRVEDDGSDNDAEKCVDFDASTFGRDNASIFVIEARGRVGNHLMAYTLIKAFQAKLNIQVIRMLITVFFRIQIRKHNFSKFLGRGPLWGGGPGVWG